MVTGRSQEMHFTLSKSCLQGTNQGLLRQGRPHPQLHQPPSIGPTEEGEPLAGYATTASPSWALPSPPHFFFIFFFYLLKNPPHFLKPAALSASKRGPSVRYFLMNFHTSSSCRLTGSRAKRSSCGAARLDEWAASLCGSRGSLGCVC